MRISKLTCEAVSNLLTAALVKSIGQLESKIGPKTIIFVKHCFLPYVNNLYANNFYPRNFIL